MTVESACPLAQHSSVYPDNVLRIMGLTRQQAHLRIRATVGSRPSCFFLVCFWFRCSARSTMCAVSAHCPYVRLYQVLFSKRLNRNQWSAILLITLGCMCKESGKVTKFGFQAGRFVEHIRVPATMTVGFLYVLASPRGKQRRT